MSAKNGGPAFPYVGKRFCSQSGFREVESEGMTLRDFFAAKAMQGLLAGNIYNPVQADEIAKDSKAIAEAMIAAREMK